MARRVSRGEIWTFQFAAPDKRRPVLVLTRQEVVELLHKETGDPFSTGETWDADAS